MYRALIANPPNSAQLGGTPPTIPPSYIRVRAVVWKCGEGQTHTHTHTHTHTYTQTPVTNIRFASSATHAKCNEVRSMPYFSALTPLHGSLLEHPT